MNCEVLPFELEEVSEEERASTNLGRLIAKVDNRQVRSSPGNVLLPYAFVHIADKFYNFEFRSDDIIVLTFPKSGTVWSAEIIWAMTHLDQIDSMESAHINTRNFFLDLDFLNPAKKGDESPLIENFREVCPEGQIEDGVMLQMAKSATGRRIIKSHLPLRFFNSQMLSTSKVVYVARNPKDTCVSFFHFLSKRPGMDVNCDIETFADIFMTGQVNYTPYWPHVKEAWDLKDHPNFHFVFYEDLKSDIMKELKGLSTFLELDLNDDQLNKVIEATTFQRMKERDLQKPFARMEGSFFRKGIVGDWKNMLTTNVEAKMDQWIEENTKNMDIKFKYN